MGGGGQKPIAIGKGVRTGRATSMTDREDLFAMDLNLQTDNQHYARALRAIGQDLADLFPHDLEIEVNGEELIARGQGMAEENLLRKVWNKLVGQDRDIVQWQLSFVPFVRTYSQEDIDRLDKSGSNRRNVVTEIPDIYSLGERLRTVGRIVDMKGAQLVKLSKNLNNLVLQYRDKRGQIYGEEYTTFALCRIQQEYYSGRDIFKTDNLWQEMQLKKAIGA